MPRKNAARPTDRTNATTTASEDAPAVMHQNTASSSKSKPVTNRVYEATRISGKSHTIQGDVFNNYNHFYGDKLAWSDADTPDIADTSGASVASKLRSLVPESISSYDAQRETRLRSASRLSATCQWIFENEKYTDWQSSRGPPILIWTGPVGCGKSIAASAVIDHLGADQSNDVTPVISYFVDAARNERITTREILLAMIKQMLLIHQTTRGQLSQEMQQTIGACLRESDDVLTIATLTQIAIDLIQQQGPYSFVVDGIDAMEEPDILAFIRLLSKIFDRSGRLNLSCKLILFCRETLGRGIRLQNVPQACVFDTEAVHVRRDICLYVDHEVHAKQMERSISADDALINRVKRVLKENAERMFLWVRLQILTIWDPNHTTCDQDIEDQLRELPEGLDDIYLRCLNRIDTSNEQRSQDIAPKVFKWVACAKEPFTQLQAREAVSLTPHNLPLQKSKVLSSPVTDYCANLVTLNHITGTVTFPHPTVKDFLCDLSKLPPHLHKYHIALEADDLWLGEICVAYAKILPVARSLAQYRKLKFDSRIPSSIIQNNFTWLQPIGWLQKQPSPPKASVEVPVVFRPPQGLVGSSFSLHEYVCKHWLEHNRRIQEADNPAYQNFIEICLGHNAELQPWTKGYGSDVERYQQTVQHAVMTDHGPLLLVISEHLEPFKETLYAQVFLRSCPGTDSSFLHVAAALGHLDVLPVLRRHYSDILANLKGQSSAAVAAENFQQAAFEMLCTPWLFNFRQRLESLGKEIAAEECLIHVCAAYGNAGAIEYVLRNARLDVEEYRRELNEAFLIVCFKGHTTAALSLVLAGVDPNDLQSQCWSRQIFRFFDSITQKALERWAAHNGSSLDLALKLGRPDLMETLLTCGASFSARDDHCDVLDVIQHYKARQDLHEAARFIEILTQHGHFLNKTRRPEETIWPLYLLELVRRAWPSKLWWSQIRIWSRFMRMIMDYSRGCVGRNLVDTLRYRVTSGSDNIMGSVLSQAPDDILVHMLRHWWFDEEYLLRANSLNFLLQRGTSRCMEALIDCLGISEVLMVQAFGLTNRCLTLADLLNFWSCGSKECRQVRKMTIRCTTWKELSALDNADSVRNIIDHERIHRVQCHGRNVDYYNLLETATRRALQGGRQQTLDFIGCYAHCQRECNNPFHQGSSISHVQSIYVEEESTKDRPRALPLMWHRCCQKAGGDIAKARTIYRELLGAGSQANLALNWPAGHLRVTEGDGKTAGVKLSVKLALCHWNFNLNRSRRKAFSLADEWFMGVKLVLGVRDKLRKHC